MAESTRKLGCKFCKSPLHFARYVRKGRSGTSLELPEGWNIFYSFCCSREGCRKRNRPLSVRYAGQSPHSASLLILAHLFSVGSSFRSIKALVNSIEVSERTIRRWMKMWKYIHNNSLWWRKLASMHSLNGQCICSLFKLENYVDELSALHNIKIIFENLILQSAALWLEIFLFVGNRLPAKVA